MWNTLTLQSNLVPLQAVHRLLEEGLTASGLTRDIVLLPLNGHLEGIKDLLDRVGDFLTDTVTGNESDSVLAAKFGRKLNDGILANGLFIRFDVARVARPWKAEQCRHQRATHPLLVGKSGHSSGDRDALWWWKTGHGERDTSEKHRDISAVYWAREGSHVKAGCRSVLTLAEAFLREPATEDLIELASIVLYYYYFCAKSRAGEIYKETKEMSYAAVSRWSFSLFPWTYVRDNRQRTHGATRPITADTD